MLTFRRPHSRFLTQRDRIRSSCIVMRQGFTLSELVIAVLVMGILAATAVPQYSVMLNHYRVEGAAAQLAADLNWARRHARQKGANQPVNFTLPFQYAMPGMSDPDHPSQGFVVDFTQSHPGVSILSVDFDSNTTATFDLYGRPCTGSPLVPLAANGIVTLAAGGETRTVTLHAVSGRVSSP